MKPWIGVVSPGELAKNKYWKSSRGISPDALCVVQSNKYGTGPSPEAKIVCETLSPVPYPLIKHPTPVFPENLGTKLAELSKEIPEGVPKTVMLTGIGIEKDDQTGLSDLIDLLRKTAAEFGLGFVLVIEHEIEDIEEIKKLIMPWEFSTVDDLYALPSIATLCTAASCTAASCMASAPADNVLYDDNWGTCPGAPMKIPPMSRCWITDGSVYGTPMIVAKKTTNGRIVQVKFTHTL